MSDISNIINNLPLDHFSTLYIGLSGGIDSTVLLHAISQNPLLIDKLKAIYICHNINVTYSQTALKGSVNLCRQLNIPLIIKTLPVNLISHTKNVEEQARLARFQAFEEILEDNDALILGHHQNDQAETLLLRLFRGAGVTGLSSMKPVSHHGNMTVFRPLLAIEKSAIYAYATHHQLSWVEDPSNTDINFDRNFIRNELLPLLNTRFPNIEKKLSRTAKLCLENQAQLESLLYKSYHACLNENHTLCISKLLELEAAKQANIIRTWLRAMNIKMPSQAILDNFLKALKNHQIDKHPLMIIGKYHVQKHKDQLHAYANNILASPIATTDWLPPYQPLLIKSLKAHLTLSTDNTNNNIFIPNNAKLTVVARQSGEQMTLNGQTKKVKKLFQQLDIPYWQRPFIPLLFINNELAAIADKIIADPFKQPQKINYTLRLKSVPLPI